MHKASDPTSDSDQLWTTEKVAALLDVKPYTVRRWRHSKGEQQGPRFIYVGRFVRYREADVREYIATRSSTSP